MGGRHHARHPELPLSRMVLSISRLRYRVATAAIGCIESVIAETLRVPRAVTHGNDVTLVTPLVSATVQPP